MITKIQTYLQQHKKLLICVAGSMTLILAVLFAVLMLYTPSKNVTFSYAGKTCISRTTLFPEFARTQSDEFEVVYERHIQIGSISLASKTTCFTPKVAPKKGEVRVTTTLGAGVMGRQLYVIRIPDPPTANLSVLNKPMPTVQKLAISLANSDAIHQYTLVVGKKESQCPSNGRTITCDTKSLELKQNTKYKLTLLRKWRGRQVEKVAAREVMTLPATKLVSSSLASQQVLYTKDKSFAFTFDKQPKEVRAQLVRIDTGKEVPMPHNVSVVDKTVTIAADQDLPRSQSYKVIVTHLRAMDGSYIEEPHTILFTTSGGPKLVSSSIGATDAPRAGVFELTFDQPLSPQQDITKYVQVQGVAATVRAQDNKVFVQYGTVPKCVDFSVQVAKGLQSNYGIAQESPQAFSSRTACYTVETIGKSREGRALQAYYFGDGSRTILFTGAIHGSEKSSKYTMDGWIEYLKTHAREIPTDKQIVVIPVVSPDGFYMYGRFNAAGVNLNRNWPTDNWVTADGQAGPSPLSEPESQALASFTDRLKPAFVATYHAQGRLVNSNDVGLAVTLGKTYASQVGYRFIADADTAEALGGTVTGTYEDWLKTRGTPCILMELDTLGGSYFQSHRVAMWSLIQSF